MQQDHSSAGPREAPLRSLMRVIGVIAISYLIVIDGGFQHGWLTAVVCVIGIAAALASLLLSWSRWRDWSGVATAVMMLAGGLLMFQTDYAGWVVFGIGVTNLIGQPLIDLRVGVLITALASVPVVLDAVKTNDSLESIGVNLLAVVGIGVVGYSRRQARIRRAQDRALIERSRELEQRSRELIEQTERTQTETARAAALEERNRIARDIHDLLAHSLGGLVVQLDAADAVLSAGGDADQVAERVRTSRQLAVDGLREARAAVRELRSGQSTALDVQEDLAEVVDAVTRGPVGLQLGVEFDVVGQSRSVPSAVAQAFAAVAREALTNINKHAAGGRAVATLIFEPELIRLELINSLPDDHDQPAPDLVGSGGGFGVPGMQNRFTEIGGTLSAGRQDRRWVVSAGWPAPDKDGTAADDRS
ncbi:MAG TPA: histidine kinase [Microlunatus sp.]